MESVLDDIRILDLTQVLAGPFAVTILADMGADVIKLEPPSGGYSRGLTGLPDEFQRQINWRTGRNRRGITLNLTKDTGRSIFIELVKKVDIVIQNFAVGTMEKLRLGYDVLREANSKLIYCAMSGFGQTGPLSNKLAYDPSIQAYSGVHSMTGFPDKPPVRVGIQLADYAGAVYAVIGILLALRHRDKIGLGQMIDCAMYDAMLAWTGGETMAPRITGVERHGNAHPWGAPAELFKTKDNKYFMYGVQTDAQWVNFLKMIGKDDIIKENWNFGQRLMNKAQINKWADDWAKTKTLDEATKLCDEYELVNAPLVTSQELENHPQALARGCFVNLEDERGKVTTVGPTPPKLSLTPSRIYKGAPNLGEHNMEIYSSLLGYDEIKLSELKEEGII